MICSFTLRTGFVKTPPALNQMPVQAEQRGITEEQIPARESGFNLTCHLNCMRIPCILPAYFNPSVFLSSVCRISFYHIRCKRR